MRNILKTKDINKLEAVALQVNTASKKFINLFSLLIKLFTRSTGILNNQFWWINN